MSKSFYEKVYKVVRAIPIGKVATYSQIAAICGSPKASRAVGTALHKNPYPSIVPCHRVVNINGQLAKGFAFGGKIEQKNLLELENVLVNKYYRVNLFKYQWQYKSKNQ